MIEVPAARPVHGVRDAPAFARSGLSARRTSASDSAPTRLRRARRSARRLGSAIPTATAPSPTARPAWPALAASGLAAAAIAAHPANRAALIRRRSC